MIATRWVIGIEARRAFPDNLEFMVYSPVTVGPWTVLEPFRQISNRSNQLSLEQLKLPRGPEVELHGDNLTKDAERHGGYICTALGQTWQVFRLGLENRVLSETADHCFFRCQPPRVPPTPSRPVWPDVLLRNSKLWQ